jgi:hypothetical protein
MTDFDVASCNDSAGKVAAAKTALTVLEGDLAKLKTDKGTTDAAVATAMTAKQEAIAAVLAKDTELKTKLEADNTA